MSDEVTEQELIAHIWELVIGVVNKLGPVNTNRNSG